MKTTTHTQRYRFIISPKGRRSVEETVQAKSIEAAQTIANSMAARLGTTHVSRPEFLSSPVCDLRSDR